MPTFMAIHRSPGLSQDEIRANGELVAESVHASFQRLYVNLQAGCIITIYDAENKEAVEEEFERVGFPWDEVHEVHIDLTSEALGAMLGQA